MIVPRGMVFFAPNTNAAVSSLETRRINDIFLHPTSLFGPYHEGLRSVDYGSVVADVNQHILVVVQNRKGSGGQQLAIIRYASRLPSTIHTQKLPKMTMAGISPNSLAGDVYFRFGEPYSITKIVSGSVPGVETPHELGHPSWFTNDLGDGVYNYAGPVPNKSQSCAANFAIVIRYKKVLGLRESIEC